MLMSTDGFQILHAIHAVETFLSNLQRRGCRFHVLWFENHEKLCVLTDVSEVTAGFYLLTRAILIKHLQQHEAAKHITFKISSTQSDEFQNYLDGNTIRFFLCLDGFAFDGSASQFALYHLAVMQQFCCRGYSVALLNNFEFKSSKVCVFY